MVVYIVNAYSPLKKFGNPQKKKVGFWTISA